ncbi:MAG: ATP phosphoribosyltransferase [Saprospiraceae bacterium]|nr:ATP phosphoribosyltransferase [Saprospiraceae bacterium]
MAARLKIAVQKSGRLLDGSLRILRECGIKVDNGKDQLKARSSNFPIDILYLRNSDIPQYIEDGVADVAIIGENTLIEKDKEIEKILPLGFSKCRLSIALPKNTDYTGPQDLNGKRIATSYPHSLQMFLERKGVSAHIHEISGSVEIAPNIGLADAICDLVSTGSTLFKNGLEEKEIILRSEAWLVSRKGMSKELVSIFDTMVFRINSVLSARQNKYLLMNAPNESIEKIIRILPGMKSPTVMPLATKGWSSIHTVIQEDSFWEIIDKLKGAGGEGILIIPIEKMIL